MLVGSTERGLLLLMELLLLLVQRLGDCAMGAVYGKPPPIRVECARSEGMSGRGKGGCEGEGERGSTRVGAPRYKRGREGE